ncbi:uncharacterized protein Z520_08192 [Fonsecaea multimorphosa CBS 102226]|uniref:Cytochrome P450 n=1 Tax=Fonsecaea multimorphosa CBS 102226 TaxID=1442371 RepID=A0A0D2JRC5_9EURO|nr:uncharacterized protein Z520_08192 [Fonsecaea multimorphosa CBS 102226]KIX95937.1 hypothetical protein Z520_08192 [Fonsecaea multimorphosa CBS 102226]OAL21708.1 hypothetical protein AYO22_07650 [Fonsecaea multimorphosa]
MLWYLGFAVLAVVLYFSLGLKERWPDGPRGIPFLGVLPDKKLTLNQQLSKLVPRYGDFFSFNMGRSKVVVLSSPRAVDDLIVKRGQKYSSRPSSSAQAKIIGQGRMVQMEYGDEFRKHRKVIHGLLGMQNSKVFLPYQEYESRQTLRNILENPNTFYTEVARYSASVTFSLLIGARFASSSTQMPDAIRHISLDMFKKIRPGYWLADWIPVLNYLPDGLAPWRAEARKTFDNILGFWGVFYDSIVDRMHKDNAPDCFLKRFLESPEITSFSEVDKRIILSELLAAGSETTATTLQWFFKAVVLYPDSVKAAQEELDRVVGSDRLPQWEDRNKLPYIAAAIEEVHRWASVAPLAIFHATSESDSYRGKAIPARTTVIYNTSAIHHNSAYYQDHEKFIPERFLSEKDPRYRPQHAHGPTHYAFGVGRRECPGKHVADASLFIVISRLLWAFNIDLGSNPPPSDELGGGLPIFRPVPFACNITPRSEKVSDQIRAEAAIQDPALRVEDAAQYEQRILTFMEQRKVGV